MHELELVLFLLVAVAALALLSRRLGVPYPIVLVVGGLALGFVPGLPRVELAPEVVFLVFLPPLLYAAGWLTSWRDFAANRRPIGLLAVGLVLATTVGVAVVAHALIPGLPWAAAFVLGAIVSPTDAIAATAILQRLGAPGRIVTILEGESLVNDATGLVAYRFAVAAVATGAFSAWEAGGQFLVAALGGIALGLAAGWLTERVEQRLDDSPIEITLSFLVPFAAYLAAEALHLSGVLAVVAAGVYGGRRVAPLFSPATRLEANAVWGMLIFLLNGLAFILIGLQLPRIVDELAGRSPAELAVYGAAISLAVIGLRLLWVFPAAYLPHLLSGSVRAAEPFPNWRNVTVVGWAGLRGAVSLAAALALPRTLADGAPFPGRDLILFLTFCVILATLVGQGLSLPALTRALGVADDGKADAEEIEARGRAITAALGRLDELVRADGARAEAAAYWRAYYGKRAHILGARSGRLDHDHAAGDGGGADHRHEEDGRDHAAAHREALEGFVRLQRELLGAERALVIGLRDGGVIGDEALRRIERDLDLEEARLG
jgi:CPA1 family monovalent cation:H+ antiporter